MRTTVDPKITRILIRPVRLTSALLLSTERCAHALNQRQSLSGYFPHKGGDSLSTTISQMKVWYPPHVDEVPSDWVASNEMLPAITVNFLLAETTVEALIGKA